MYSSTTERKSWFKQKRRLKRTKQKWLKQEQFSHAGLQNMTEWEQTNFWKFKKERFNTENKKWLKIHEFLLILEWTQLHTKIIHREFIWRSSKNTISPIED